MADGMTPGGSAQGKQDWCTPPEVVELVHRVLGDPIDLDAFSNEQSFVRAQAHYCGLEFKESGALPRHWARDGWREWRIDGRQARTAFVQPEWRYTNKAPKGVDHHGAIGKARDEWVRVPGREVIGLFPCGPNCSGWPIVIDAPARCFPFTRIAFLEDGVPKKGNPKDVVIVYWGHDPYRFREVFRELGEVVFG